MQYKHDILVEIESWRTDLDFVYFLLHRKSYINEYKKKHSKIFRLWVHGQYATKLILLYLNMSFNRFGNRDKLLFEITDIIQVLNELPTDKRHIKVPQDRLLCPTYVNNKKDRFSKNFFLSVLHDQTSVESL